MDHPYVEGWDLAENSIIIWKGAFLKKIIILSKQKCKN